MGRGWLSAGEFEAGYAANGKIRFAVGRRGKEFGGSFMATPLVGIIMGSTSDWETMQHAAAHLELLGVPYEKRVVSAHRTPKLMVSYAESAAKRGLKVIIAGAGGAAHLPGMTAAMTSLPVLGVPVESHALKGLDSLLSIVQMPGGVPTATFAIGKAGAINAALFAASIVALADAGVAKAWKQFRAAQTAKVMKARLPEGGAS
jgi:5-(carboxyamino)imidazole ribonucleotide mutase